MFKPHSSDEATASEHKQCTESGFKNLAPNESARPNFSNSKPYVTRGALPENARKKAKVTYHEKLTFQEPTQYALGSYKLSVNADTYSIFTASIVGLTHRYYNTERQDRLRVHQAGDCLWILICDGVSSAHHGGMGAQICAESFDFTIESSATPTPSKVIQQLNAQIAQTARHRGIDPQSCKTTATVVKIDFNLKTTNIAQVGDGHAFFLHRPEKTWEPILNKSTKEELLTSYLPSPDPQMLRINQIERTWFANTVFLVMTDGIGDDIVTLPYIKDELGDLWIKPPASVSEFLAHTMYINQGSSDDRSVFAIWNNNSTEDMKNDLHEEATQSLRSPS